MASGRVRRRLFAARRTALGLTQEDLAGLLGIDRSTVARWERGETQPLPWMRPRLAKALGVGTDQLAELLDGSSAAGGQRDAQNNGADTPHQGSGTAGRGATAVVPRQLPASAPDFTGRAAELAELTTILDTTSAAPGTIVISAIGGTAGVGKTALALHWAHRFASRFPDGQLHANLRGFDPSGVPVSPEEVIRGFLHGLGVAPDRVPNAPDAQAGLYRSMLAGKRMLIMLDNARDEEQVRPLLPASPGSLVLITSRNRLPGLIVSNAARLVSLDVLTTIEAVQLLTARLGKHRATAEPGAVAEIAGHCACLPLALTVAAAEAATRPERPLAALAAELRDAAGRLDTLDTGDPTVNVRAVFSWSYRQLSAASARMFRLLGLHPGPDITVPAAASLAAVDEPEGRRLLSDLARAHLIAEHAPGRYACHDLLRAYAADQARCHDSEAERETAVGRVLDHYLHTASAASLLLRPSRDPVPLPRPRPGVALGQFADHGQATAWFAAEHEVLLAAIALAAETGFGVHAWQLSWAIVAFLSLRGEYQEWAAIERRALATANRIGDAAGKATSGRLLADVSCILGDYAQAIELYTTSLELYRQLGNRLGEAAVLEGLGVVADRQARYTDALGHDEHALRLYQSIGDKTGEAGMLGNVAWSYARLGDYEQARAFCQRSLTLCAELGNRLLEGITWDIMGYSEHHLRDFTKAIACYQRALIIFRELGAHFNEAQTLGDLGDTWHAAGHLLEARQAWQQALDFYEGQDHPDAEEIRAKLAGPSTQDGDGRH